MIRESHDHYRRRSGRYKDLWIDLWLIAAGIFIGLVIARGGSAEATGEPGIYPGPIGSACVQGRFVVQVDPETVVTLPIECVEP